MLSKAKNNGFVIGSLGGFLFNKIKYLVTVVGFLTAVFRLSFARIFIQVFGFFIGFLVIVVCSNSIFQCLSTTKIVFLPHDDS